MAKRPTEDDLHEEAVRNGELEDVICQRCPWCKDPGLPDGETAFGVAEVNLDDPRPVGCDVNECVNMIGGKVDGESFSREGFEILEEIEALVLEVHNDSDYLDEFLSEEGVWSWHGSGEGEIALWSATYYCVENGDRSDLKNALLKKKAELEKALENEEDEVEEDEYDWFNEEGSDEDADTEPHTDDNAAQGNTVEGGGRSDLENARLADDEIRITLESRDDPTQPSNIFYQYECGLVTDEIFVYSTSKSCPRCGKQHPLGKNVKNVTARVLQVFFGLRRAANDAETGQNEEDQRDVDNRPERLVVETPPGGFPMTAEMLEKYATDQTFGENPIADEDDPDAE